MIKIAQNYHIFNISIAASVCHQNSRAYDYARYTRNYCQMHRLLRSQEIHTRWPLCRQCEIPWHFPDSLRHSFAALGILSVTHIMPVLVLNTCMNANIQLTINSFRQLFPDKIFSLTFSTIPDSCQIPQHFQTSGHLVHKVSLWVLQGGRWNSRVEDGTASADQRVDIVPNGELIFIYFMTTCWQLSCQGVTN